jgi:hypothetical protein
MTAPAPTRLTARGPEDLLALVPVVLGFAPADSVVMLTFGPEHGFHARLDLPPPDVPVDEWAEMLLAPARQHRVERVAFVAYAAAAEPAGRTLCRLVRLFREAGIDVVEALRADGCRWWPVPPGGEPPGAGTPYDVGSHPFAAHAVVEGVVVHESRAHLAATLDPVAERLAPGRGIVVAPGPLWVWSTLSRLARERAVADAGDAVRLLRAVHDDEAARDAAWLGVSRADAAAHVAVWTDLVRRAPDELLGDAAAVLAMLAWIAGQGALAWCAVDRCRTVDPHHTLATVVSDLLAAAVSPRAWDDRGRSDHPW